jgi:hypothetical protein
VFGLATSGDVPEVMFQVPNTTAQLMADSLLGRGILCLKRGIRGDVLGHVFGPNDFLRKQIKAEGEKQRGSKTRDHMRKQEANQRKNSLSNHAFLWDAALLGLLAFVHGLGVFSSESRGEDEK